ncbi:MAG TPA: nucleotidyltransferase domain-containing protein [Thermoanaerobaculia bacterium]|nr:nucleotidyltransferase domain-containing protein [Thermoanaerobaculia bacterium]
MRTHNPLVESLREALRGRKDVHLALLFGSRARGEAHPGSDVDVAVLGRDLDLLEFAADLSRATKTEADVVSLEDPGYPLLNAILRDGLLLHEEKPGAAAAWRGRAWLQAETDRPWFERMRDSFLKRLAEGRNG